MDGKNTFNNPPMQEAVSHVGHTLVIDDYNTVHSLPPMP